MSAVTDYRGGLDVPAHTPAFLAAVGVFCSGVFQPALRQALRVEAGEPRSVMVTAEVFTVDRSSRRPSREELNLEVAQLLEEWMTEDDGGFDERMWPQLEQELRDNPVRFGE